EPLEPGMTIALPDLHAFAATLPVRHAAASRAAASPRVAHAPVHRSAAGSATALAAAASAPAAKERVPSPPRRDEPRAGAAEGFRLRLSAPVIDLAPSRAMDERKRAELRERLLVLESDDRTAAMLAMREDIRRLESQVRQLKLRLATLAPAAGPAPESAKPVGAAPRSTEDARAGRASAEGDRAEAGSAGRGRDGNGKGDACARGGAEGARGAHQARRDSACTGGGALVLERALVAPPAARAARRRARLALLRAPPRVRDRRLRRGRDRARPRGDRAGRRRPRGRHRPAARYRHPFGAGAANRHARSRRGQRGAAPSLHRGALPGDRERGGRARRSALRGE